MPARTAALLTAALGAALAPALVGCAAKPAPEPAPRPRAQPAAQARTASRSAPRPRQPQLPAGHVQFTVEGADLRTRILPLFARQAGVAIEWEGPSRTASLRLTQPVPWQTALDLVCRFTRTHLTRDYRGKLVLKDGWGGSLTGGEDLDLLVEGTRGGRSGGGASAARRGGRSGGGVAPSGGGSGSSGSSGSGPTWSNTYGGGADNDAGRTARELLRGTTRTRSGSR